MQQCKLRLYSHIQANYGHASKMKLIMEAMRRLPWYACTRVCVCALIRWVISYRIPRRVAHLLAEMHQATTPIRLRLCALVRLRLYDTPTTPLGHQIERGYNLPKSDLYKAN